MKLFVDMVMKTVQRYLVNYSFKARCSFLMRRSISSAFFYPIKKSIMKFYITIVFLLFLFSCLNKQERPSRYTEEQIASLQLDSTKILYPKTDSTTKINLNPFLQSQSFGFGELIKEIKLVPLETNANSLLDAIINVLVTDSSIYVHDKFKDGGLVIFDRSGNFIKRIPNGRGPGELNRLYDIAFDEENNELVAYQHSFLLFFNASGEFIRQERLPFGFYNFTITPKGYIFKSLAGQGDDHLGPFKKYTLFVTNKNFKLKSAGLPSPIDDDQLIGFRYLYNNININITQTCTDTIYQYNPNTNQLIEKYVLDYRQKKLPKHYFTGSWDEFKNAIEQNDYFFFIGEFLETKSHQVFYLQNWHKNIKPVIYRNIKSRNLKGGTNADFNLTEIPPIAFPRWTSGEYFISAYFYFNRFIALNNSNLCRAAVFCDAALVSPTSVHRSFHDKICIP